MPGGTYQMDGIVVWADGVGDGDGSARGCCTAARDAAADACGSVTSSMSRSVIATSPLSAGLGPFAGNDSTFHGQRGGSIHSTASRSACPAEAFLRARRFAAPRHFPARQETRMGKSKRVHYVSFPASLLRVKQRRQLVSVRSTGTRGRNSCPEPHELMRTTPNSLFLYRASASRG